MRGYKEGRVGTETSPGATSEHVTFPEQLGDGEGAWETAKVTEATTFEREKGA